MKITLEFDTNSEDFDRHELMATMQAIDMLVALGKIQEQCRQWYKYDDRSAIPAEEVRDTINEIINDQIDMEKLGY